MNFRIIVISMIICIVSLKAQSQNFKLYNHLNSTIPSDKIDDIGIDHHGNKWMLSRVGLIRYNDKEFELITIPSLWEDAKRMFDCVYIDKKGNVWVSFSGTQNGIARFDGANWSIFTVKNIAGLEDVVLTATEDEKGKLYFGTTKGVVTYDGLKWAKFALPKENLYQYTIRAIAINKDDEIVFSCDNGLMFYNGIDWKTLNESNSELRLETVKALKFMPSGALYIGYGGGFGKGGFSVLKDGLWKHYDKFNSQLPDQMVRDIAVSKNGALWFATNDGVLKIEGEKFTPIKFFPGMYQNAVSGIATEGNKAWIALFGKGLVEIDE